MPVLSATIDLVSDSTPEYGSQPLKSPAPVAVPADLLKARIHNIVNERNGVSSSQLSQAERMVKRSRLELTSGQEGDNVAVPIPPVDRGRGDPRNIIAIITDRDVRILCKSGILKGSLHAYSLICTSQRLLTDAEINRTESVTLRQAVNHESNCDGHRNMLGVTVLVLKDARPIDADVSKTKFNVPTVVC